MDKKNTKTPTEPIRLDDVWNGFKTDYLPFIQWLKNRLNIKLEKPVVE